LPAPRLHAKLDFKSKNSNAFGGIAPILGSWKVPHQTPIQGWWFAGAQSESGGGVNSVIPGAYKTARRILKVSA
jgi:phytoene dehydrogenase-like protein